VKGGFRLAKEPKEINIYTILRASEGVMTLVDCENMDCRGRDKNKCVTRPVWAGAADVLKEYFSAITLQDLLDQVELLETSGTTSYSI
jgi:Rrf2 family protein